MQLKSHTATDFPGIEIETKRFPDGEFYIRLPELDSDVFLFHRCYPNSNENLLWLLLCSSEIKRKAKKLQVFIPYLPYARQDKEFKKGEAINAKNICFLLKKSGVDELITYDCHFLKKEGVFEIEGLKITNKTARDLLISEMKKFSNDFVVISPDEGASYMAETHLKKKRGDYAKSNIVFREIEKMETPEDFAKKIANKDILIIDDMIASGGTMIKAIQACKQNHAKRIFCAATHGLFLNNAYKRIKQAGAEKIFTTNSIQTTGIPLTFQI